MMEKRTAIRHRVPLGGLFQRAGSAGKTVLAVAGVWAIGSAALEYKWDREIEEARRRHRDTSSSGEDEEAKKKEHQRVLVLPFHRMKIVEKRKPNVFTSVAPKIFGRLSSDDTSPLEIEVHDLVHLIHEAAADKDIVDLYGIFGHGNGFGCGGYAHVEEIRNAIRVFNESHRVHREPNLEHKAVVLPRNGDAKLSYAFADTFGNLDSGNKEYFLASAFTHVQMQQQGDLNLFGVGMSVPFLRSALDKYGIIAHVFKNGKYKNAANSLTETGFTKEHKENTTALVRSINQSICQSIAKSRSLPDSFNERMWNSIHNYGSLTAENAKEIGLLDFLPLIDPLDSLLRANTSDEAFKQERDKWGKSIDFGNFKGTKTISLQEYKSVVAKRKSSEERNWKKYELFKHFAEKSTATRQLVSLFKYSPPNYNIEMDEYNNSKHRGEKEKIAVVHVSGSIISPMAKKITDTLKKIKNDDNVKCVVLRVDSSGGSAIASEAIYQECKDMPQPVICSMSNLAASGGYYLSSHCDRIFALPTTITGSIGVFGVKFDATGLARDYGVNVEHVGSGIFTAANSPFQPMVPKVEASIRRRMDMTYDTFKGIVSSGRNLSLDEVEARAQGRVWTGNEALDRCLVDELGGLDRALSYAKRNYTSAGDADVEFWPKAPSMKELFSKVMGRDKEGAVNIMQYMWNNLMMRIGTDTFVDTPDTLDEMDLAKVLLGGGNYSPTLLALSANARAPEPMLTIDANEALKVALQDASS